MKTTILDGLTILAIIGLVYIIFEGLLLFLKQTS